MKRNGRHLVETIGVPAVVLSLLFVAYEIRQANRIAVVNGWLASTLAFEKGVSTEQTQRNVLENIDNAIARASPRMREIWRASLDSFPSLADSVVFRRARAALQEQETR